MEVTYALKESVFIKIGGSCITDKTTVDSLREGRIRDIARSIATVTQDVNIELILGHGAGAYGHIKAQEFSARAGIHPVHGWSAFHRIRQDMIRMNLRFLELCAAEQLYPITVQPSAILMAREGSIVSIHSDIIRSLLRSGQIPLLHGDIVLDQTRGFTIASTEAILTALSQEIYFDRVVMISDVPGVLDGDQRVIRRIGEDNYHEVIAHLGVAKGADVTGGMKSKVERLYSLVRLGKIRCAFIISGESDIAATLRGTAGHGTRIE